MGKANGKTKVQHETKTTGSKLTVPEQNAGIIHYMRHSVIMHYVFTQILHYPHAALDCASMETRVLHFQICFSNRGTGVTVNQPPIRSASFRVLKPENVEGRLYKQ
ncbi:hypothetical protein T09_1439 [Trichinella sp. T9]|uniref:Uncharacterized protein n=1 Tax=Trichinella murrelli TaxID=144512 RepID=A0A0V0TXG1_9BILA|nr:hypothetical protein T05_14797 [Trichinella murrelli]KRX67542.1 hypothetical protein T09_1439 [Trichinella sp. T9]